MKLTNRNAWNTYAGGTGAADHVNSYDVVLDVGRYSIQPISHQANVQHHLGYRVHFVNDKGKLTGGLWQQLSPYLVNLLTARRLCEHHRAEHFG